MSRRQLTRQSTWSKKRPESGPGITVTHYGNGGTGSATLTVYHDPSKCPVNPYDLRHDAVARHSEVKVVFTDGTVVQGRNFPIFSQGMSVLVPEGPEAEELRAQGVGRDWMKIPGRQVPYGNSGSFNPNVETVEVVRDSWEIAGYGTTHNMIAYRDLDGFWYADSNGPFTVEELYELPMIDNIYHMSAPTGKFMNSGKTFWATDPILLETATGVTWFQFYRNRDEHREPAEWATRTGSIVKVTDMDYSKFERHPNILAELEYIGM